MELVGDAHRIIGLLKIKLAAYKMIVKTDKY